jgi:GMP synthase (glutamine-hydrolysing)
MIEQEVQRIKDLVADANVIAGVSGGVDSSVAAALVHRAIGTQLSAVFVDTGLLRLGEADAVKRYFSERMGSQFVAIDAAKEFISALKDIEDPETKRKIIGELFIRVFEAHAGLRPNTRFLVQGTIYPDVIESSGPGRELAARIKTHHNVGGLPAEMDFELVEPLRSLFKDEVREVGRTLGLPDELIWRQPFPGPGLAVRCIGKVSPARLERLRYADDIFMDELEKAGLLRMETAQAFAVLLPVRAVGVMGDQRTHQETIVLRAVTTQDFMTADWARLSADLLAIVSNRITNEVEGINRVLYDITSKPPATIEWE